MRATIITGLSWGVFAIAAVLGGLLIVVPALTGSHVFTVLTASMAPQFPPGSVVVVRPVTAVNVRLGDVISFTREGEPGIVVTHRVSATGQAADGSPLFVTRGDANPADDAGMVDPQHIIGAVAYGVPAVGWARQLVPPPLRESGPQVLAVVLFAYGVVLLVQAGRERRHRTRRFFKEGAEHG